MRCSLKVSAFVILSLLFTIFSARRLESQSTSAPQTSPSITLPGSQSPFTGSEPEAQTTPYVIQLTFQEAINRGLRSNLGLLLAGDQTLQARGERWKELSNLLPDLFVFRGFFGGEPPVADNTLHGCCLLGTS